MLRYSGCTRRFGCLGCLDCVRLFEALKNVRWISIVFGCLELFLDVSNRFTVCYYVLMCFKLFRLFVLSLVVLGCLCCSSSSSCSGLFCDVSV